MKSDLPAWGWFRKAGFTLIELLVTVGIIVILASLVVASLPQIKLAARRTGSLSNLRGIGAGMLAFANDNDNMIPSRVTNSGANKWPALLLPYVDSNPKIYGEPDDMKCFIRTGKDPISNDQNNTSYIMNGFNDIGAYTNPDVTVRLVSLQRPSETILMACQSGTGNFYMDFVEGNQDHVLNLNAYGVGSNYLFADGSARFIASKNYDNRLWLIDKSAPIPPAN